MYPSLIYYMSPSGRLFTKYLKIVHDVSSDVISKRMKILVNICKKSCHLFTVHVVNCMLMNVEYDDQGLFQDFFSGGGGGPEHAESTTVMRPLPVSHDIILMESARGGGRARKF